MKVENSSEIYVRRMAKAVLPDGSTDERWLEDWRDAPAYILLGDPGAGKSHSLSIEAAAVGEKVISASTIQAELEPLASSNHTVFIDALDEVRGGGARGSDALGAIGRWLQRSGFPNFRLACREADWRGEADRQLIERAAPGGSISILHLEPLTDSDIRTLLEGGKKVHDIDDFLDKTVKHGVSELLRNPLLLDLMARAVADNDGTWPRTRTAVYESACRRLAEEASEVHLRQIAMKPGVIDAVLDDAGTLCSLLLLSGNRAVTLSGTAKLGTLSVPSLPSELAFSDLEAALKSKVFTVEGNIATPRHRTIAEYLAARALSVRIAQGLPLSRVLAVMLAYDGKPVEAMRGLCAWLTVHLAGENRGRMLRLDPIGFVLNGDASALTHSERIAVVEALSQSATENQWFRSDPWIDHPFGPLATPDMTEVYRAELANPDRGPTRQVFIDCLLDALKHAPEPIPELAEPLKQWFTDGTALSGLRVTAYEAWKRHCPVAQQASQILAWLDELEAESIPDSDESLLGRLLTDAYPKILGVEVLRYFHPRRQQNILTQFSSFWGYHFIQTTPPSLLAELADAWAAKFPDGITENWRAEGQGTADTLLARALEVAGDTVDDARLYIWLGIGLDNHGYDRSDKEARQRITSWLEMRPDRMKALVEWGFQIAQPERQKQHAYWQVEARLHNATRPTDWVKFLMGLVFRSHDVDFVRWIVDRVASMALDPPLQFDVPTLDEVSAWVQKIGVKYPEAEIWLQEAWTISLEDWRAEEHQRKLRYREEKKHEREKRAKDVSASLEEITKRPLPVSLLHSIAFAYEKRFFNIEGATPEERVQDLLGSSPEVAQLALAELDSALDRSDLPTVDEIFESERKGKFHYLRSPALLAAKRAIARSADAWKSWDDGIVARLIAFRLTYGVDELPAWFEEVSEHRPEVVAPILRRYISKKLRLTGPQSISGVWLFTQEARFQRLTRLVLPDLLSTFPTRAHEHAREVLNRYLLPALHVIPADQALSIINERLHRKSIDVGQRISWLVALLPHEPNVISDIVSAVGRSERLAVILGYALREQGTLGRNAASISPACIKQLVEILAPITSYEPDWPGGIVTEEREREKTVEHLLQNLGGNPSAEAREVLIQLNSEDILKSWKKYVEFQLQAQRRIHREVTFKAASTVAIAGLLANRQPANGADLLALVTEHLLALEAELRGSAAFRLSEYWNDEHLPREEERCRDLILASLKTKLEFHKVDLQPESRAAAAKRMDLRATAFSSSGKSFSLPIEIKKDSNREVWTAWRTQLRDLYAIDPTTEGLGIYLVLWFGHKTIRSPEGSLPLAASDLRTQLLSRMPDSDKSKLSIVVLDLSWPSTAKR